VERRAQLRRRTWRGGGQHWRMAMVCSREDVSGLYRRLAASAWSPSARQGGGPDRGQWHARRAARAGPGVCACRARHAAGVNSHGTRGACRSREARSLGRRGLGQRSTTGGAGRRGSDANAGSGRVTATRAQCDNPPRKIPYYRLN
jgi:hypothetical protein